MKLFPAGALLLGLAASSAAFGLTGFLVYTLVQLSVAWLKAGEL